MIEIPLTKGYVAIVDDEDADLAQFKWQVLLGKHNTYGKTFAPKNRIPGAKRTSLYIHREVMMRVIGRELLTKEQVDHIDGNGLNNSRSNLRLCTPSQNLQNRKKENGTVSSLKGVTRQHGAPNKPWKATIYVNGKKLYLGGFEEEEEAHEAYRKAAQEYFGEFWRAA